jgi:hypothetical protein
MSAIPTKPSPKRDDFLLAETGPDLRCRHKTASGRRCERQPASANYGFCPLHASEGQRFRDAEAAAIASELFGPESNFGDATVVNQVLGKLFTLVAQGRIPVSTAALLAQIGQLLIQGLQGPHGDVRLAEVNNAWRQTIVNVLNSADRDSRGPDIASVRYEDLGRRIDDSREQGATVRETADANYSEES